MKTAHRHLLGLLLCALLTATHADAWASVPESSVSSPRAVPPASTPTFPAAVVQLDAAASLWRHPIAPHRAPLDHRVTLSAGPQWRIFEATFSLSLAHVGDADIHEAARTRALHLGLGVGARYFADRMVSRLSLGPTILLSRSFRHAPGKVGLFLDWRPAGFRFPRRGTTLEFHPLGLLLQAPILSDVPLAHIVFYAAFSVALRVAAK
ncbi:MAG: hypothetical protein M0R76_01370 [Proteobacteria bacterium]|nr:hypothetical protein [Pseudomonadota bacterium]